MKRQEHVFQFLGREISYAARKEHDYHQQRLEYWRAEREKAVATAKTAGFEVREYEVTGGKNANIVIDPEVTARLNVCLAKISSHHKAADVFQIEAAIYGEQAGRTYELHIDDVVYFRLASEPRVPVTDE